MNLTQEQRGRIWGNVRGSQRRGIRTVGLGKEGHFPCNPDGVSALGS